MKIRNEDRFVRSSVLKSTNAFQISASSHMFRVLSDGMYSDKVSAVIRELTCNARDAHTAAGKEHVPYEVHLPTQLEPHFHVRDEGIGLCFDDIMKLYTTYGASLKNESNDMIGGLGLGSKAGFAYADQYTVEGRWEGKRHLFSCYVDEKGEPQIAHLNTTDTTDCNGLTVTIPVERGDVGEFIDKATVLFEYYVPRPKCNTDIEYPENKATTMGSVTEGWEIFETVGYSGYGRPSSRAMAIQGQVCYPIDHTKLIGIKQEHLELLRVANINLWFDIGELEVAANRESLSYSDFTIKNIDNRLKQLSSKVIANAQETIKDCESLWDASIKASEMSSIFAYNRLLKNLILDSLTFNGKPIHSLRIEMNPEALNGIWDGLIREVPQSAKQETKLNFRDAGNYDNWRVESLKHRKLYFFNTINKKYKLPSTIHAHLDGTPAHVILLEGSKHSFNKLLDYLGNPPYTDIATLAVPETVKQGTRAVAKATIKRYVKNYYDNYVDVEHDMSLGGVYVKLLRGYPSEQNPNDIKRKVDFLRETLGDTTEVYGIPGTFHNRLDKNIKVWKTLDEHYENKCKKARLTLGNKAEINKFLELSTVYRSMDNSLRNFLTIFNDDSTIKFRYNVLNSSLKDYKQFLKLNAKYIQKSDSIDRLFSSSIDIDYAYEHKKEVDKVWAKHPILRDGLNTHYAGDLKAMRPDLETLLEKWSN